MTHEEYLELGFVVTEIIKELIETDLKGCSFKMTDIIKMISYSLGIDEIDIKTSLREYDSPYRISKATFVLDGELYSSAKLRTYAKNIERRIKRNEKVNEIFNDLHDLKYI